MGLLLWAVTGAIAAAAVIFVRGPHKIVGFRRHLLTGSISAIIAGFVYGWIGKIPLQELDFGRFILCFVVGGIGANISIVLFALIDHRQRK